MGVETALAIGTLAVGAFGAREGRQARRQSSRMNREAQARETKILQDEQTTRQNRQRSALQPSPTLFDLLRGPGG